MQDGGGGDNTVIRRTRVNDRKAVKREAKITEKVEIK